MSFEIKKDKLKKKGYNTAIYSCHTIKPLDENGIAKVLKKYEKVIVMEEHVPNGGLKDKILAISFKNNINLKVYYFTLKINLFTFMVIINNCLINMDCHQIKLSIVFFQKMKKKE